MGGRKGGGQERWVREGEGAGVEERKGRWGRERGPGREKRVGEGRGEGGSWGERWAGEEEADPGGRGGWGQQNAQDPLQRPHCAGVAGGLPEPTPLPKLPAPRPLGSHFPVQVPINILLNLLPQQHFEQTAPLPCSQGGHFQAAFAGPEPGGAVRTGVWGRGTWGQDDPACGT